MFESPDQKDYKEKQKEAKDKMNTAMALANSSLNSNNFKEYKKGIKVAEEKMLKMMIAYTKLFVDSGKIDLNSYGETMLRYITKLEEVAEAIRFLCLKARLACIAG
mgnify:CR=1 FL=1